MIKHMSIGFAMVASLGLMGNAYGQSTNEGEELSPGDQRAHNHSEVREAHRQAMHQQMQIIQGIEDPEERERRMQELRDAMHAMRNAMRDSNHSHRTDGSHRHWGRPGARLQSEPNSEEGVR